MSTTTTTTTTSSTTTTTTTTTTRGPQGFVTAGHEYLGLYIGNFAGRPVYAVIGDLPTTTTTSTTTTSTTTSTSTTTTTTTSTTTTTTTTASDRRLKRNIKRLATFMGFRVYSYNFVGSAKRVVGLMAQEVYELCPDAVVVGGDNPAVNPWRIDYAKLFRSMCSAKALELFNLLGRG